MPTNCSPSTPFDFKFYGSVTNQNRTMSVPEDWTGAIDVVPCIKRNSPLLYVSEPTIIIVTLPSFDTTPPVGDTTQPVLNMPANQNFTTDGISQTLVFQNDPATWSFPSNSTGYYYVVAGVTATDDVGVVSGPTCTAVAPNGNTWSVPPAQNHTVRFNSQFGTTTITCTATDAAGNVGTASFTVTVNLEGAEAAAEIVIPSWIKNNAGWWADGQIDDRAFVSGLQWLISNGIMNIPPTEQGAGSDDVIPGWIKNNAGWWADDLIDDRNFVTGLQWLITNGIMIIG